MGVFSRVKDGVRYILTSELPRSSTTSVDSADRPRLNRRKTNNRIDTPAWKTDELERLEETRGREGNKVWEDDKPEDRPKDTLRGRHRRHSSGARENEVDKKPNRPRERRRKSWHPKKLIDINNVEEQRQLEPKTQAFPSANNAFWNPVSIPNLREYTKEQQAVWAEEDKKQREKKRVRREEPRSARKGNETIETKGKEKAKKKHNDKGNPKAKEAEESNERRMKSHEWKHEKRKAEERRGPKKENKEVGSGDKDVRGAEHREHEQKSAGKVGRVKIEPETRDSEERSEQREAEGKREVEKIENKREEEEEKEGKEKQQHEQQRAPYLQADRKEQDKRRVKVQAQKEKYLKDVEAKKRVEKESEEKLVRQKVEAEKAKKEAGGEEHRATFAKQQEKTKLENKARRKREAQETLAKQRKKLQQEQENARQQHLQVSTNKNLKSMNVDIGNMDRTYIEGFHQHQTQQPPNTKVNLLPVPSSLSETNLKAHTADGDGSDLGNMDRTYIEGFYGCGDCIGCRKYQNCVKKEWLKAREKGIVKNSVAHAHGKVLPGDLEGVGEAKGSVMRLG